MNNYKKIILDNGIPLYLDVNKNLKEVFVGYLVDYGNSGKWFDFNLDGKDYHVLPGMAHFLEHILGEKSKYGNIYMTFSRKNNEANASTGIYKTFFNYYGISDILISLKELIEAMEDPVFTKKDVESTKKAIAEEASMILDDHNTIITNMTTQNLYGDFDSFDKTFTSIGDRETTRQIDYDSLMACYKAFYQDKNKKIVISGNVNEKEIVDLLNELYAKLPKKNGEVILPKFDYDPLRTGYEEIQRDIRTPMGSIGFKIKKPENLSRLDLSYCIDIIAQYLLGNDSEFSLYIRDSRLIDVFKSSFMTWNEDYLEFIHSYASFKNSEYYKVLVDKINRKDITKEDFEMTKKVILADEVRSFDYKYNSPARFEVKSCYTDNYSDIDYYASVDYERFKEMMNLIDFNQHTQVVAKQLKR